MRAEIDRLRAAALRQLKADATLYSMPQDCSRDEHEAAIQEHDDAHAALGEVLHQSGDTGPKHSALAACASIAADVDADIARLTSSLRGLLELYTDLVNCGDCGNWDPEREDQVIAARAALADIAKATGCSA